MNEVGLREMRQHASELVRRAQVGERLTITVAGRPAAVLGPVSAGTWRRWDDLESIFTGPVDSDWTRDQDLLDNSLTDPWSPR